MPTMPNFLFDDESDSTGSVLARPSRLRRSMASRRGGIDLRSDEIETQLESLQSIPVRPSIWSHSAPLQMPLRTPHPTPRSPPPERNEGMVDLRSLDYVSNFDSHLMCPICHCPFIDPIRLECDHIFCTECFYDAIDSAIESATGDSPTCPKCREPVEAPHGDVPRLIVNMCDEINVRCPLSPQGCTEIMERLYVQAHVDKRCGYKPMPCPDETCKETIKRKDLDPTCHHGFHACEYCHEEVMEQDMDKHLQESCSARRECQYCHTVMTNASEHRGTCSAAQFPCPAAMWGCEKIIDRLDLETHKENCALLKLSPHLKKMDDLKMRNETLENEMHRLKQMVSSAMPAGLSSERFLGRAIPLGPDTGALHTDTTNHLLSLHESLRTEIRDMDARTTMHMMNENLRLREDLTHHDAALSRLRAEMDMMIRMRQQELARSRMTAAGISHASVTSTTAAAGPSSTSSSSAEGTTGPTAARSTSTEGRLRGIGRRSSDGEDRVKL